MAQYKVTINAFAIVPVTATITVIADTEEKAEALAERTLKADDSYWEFEDQDVRDGVDNGSFNVEEVNKTEA
jgi:hypothetical protein